MKLDSPKISIAKSPEQIFEFLSNVENFEKLMPESIQKFEILDTDTFLFALKGMPEIVLKKREAEAFSRIVLGSTGGKLDFALTGTIEPDGEQSAVQLVFTGDFNPMMAMMIKGPISKFIETLVRNMPDAIQ
ncbi:MAG: SRPBCC family protein [Bacteroidia bacterium]|nr:SRPBCC family protein [Bacteroidia bacterium]NNK73055.1 SRPBCC family protein [Flavobacteriaceae bacterium]